VRAPGLHRRRQIASRQSFRPARAACGCRWRDADRVRPRRSRSHNDLGCNRLRKFLTLPGVCGIGLPVMQKRLFHCSPEPRAAGTVESPERREGPGGGGSLDRRLSETEESTAWIAQGCGGGQRLRKWLGRCHLWSSPVMGARNIRGDFGNPGRGCRANLLNRYTRPFSTFRHFCHFCHSG